MSNYNSGYIYNADGNENGIFYNMDTYIILFNLREVLNVSESLPKVIATYILRERPIKAYDAIVQSALYNIPDKISLSEMSQYSALYAITDSVGITDELSALLVLASLYDGYKIIDEVKQLSEFLLDDEFNATDYISIDTFLELIDSFGLKDLYASLATLLSLNDKFGMTDSEPRSVVSDFFIGSVGNLDSTYDWLVPFNLKIDWNTTNIQVMPESSSTIIEMPGVDGSIVESTVYKDRLFQIVAFSDEGLSIQEKESLKSKITEILDSTKHTTKKLTIEASENSFDVKYDGQAVIAEGPSYVKATIPFRAGPYGYKTFEEGFYGNGLVYNNGDSPIGPKHIIYGGAINVDFILGEIAYRWEGEIPIGSMLVIDHQMMTCYIQDEFGTKKNAMANLSGTFQKIPSHSSVALTTNLSLNNQFYTTWRDKVLW